MFSFEMHEIIQIPKHDINVKQIEKITFYYYILEQIYHHKTDIDNVNPKNMKYCTK